MARGACPAVNTLALALTNTIPFLKGEFRDVKGMSRRLQTGGNIRHQMGVCLDIILFASPWYVDKGIDWKEEKKLGENLVRAFIDLKDVMKWTEIIYQDRLFWEPEYYKPYTKDRAHFTHIHIDWMTNSLKGKGKSEDEIINNSPTINNIEFYSSLSARLDQINQQWNSGQLSSLNLATIAKTFSPDVNPVGDWRVIVGQWTWIYTFNSDGSVIWRDQYNGESGKGKWQIYQEAIYFSWINSTTTERWNLPINPSHQKGETTMKGRIYELSATRL